MGKSRLQILLDKNLSEDEMTLEEVEEAFGLINKSEYLSDENCLLCESNQIYDRKTVYDTKLCSGHALITLTLRE